MMTWDDWFARIYAWVTCGWSLACQSALTYVAWGSPCSDTVSRWDVFVSLVGLAFVPTTFVLAVCGLVLVIANARGNVLERGGQRIKNRLWGAYGLALLAITFAGLYWLPGDEVTPEPSERLRLLGTAILVTTDLAVSALVVASMRGASGPTRE